MYVAFFAVALRGRAWLQYRRTGDHGFGLTLRDVKTIEYVYRAFYEGGPDIRYSFPRGYAGQWFPSYAELMRETRPPQLSGERGELPGTP